MGALDSLGAGGGGVGVLDGLGAGGGEAGRFASGGGVEGLTSAAGVDVRGFGGGRLPGPVLEPGRLGIIGMPGSPNVPGMDGGSTGFLSLSFGNPVSSIPPIPSSVVAREHWLGKHPVCDWSLRRSQVLPGIWARYWEQPTEERGGLKAMTCALRGALGIWSSWRSRPITGLNGVDGP